MQSNRRHIADEIEKELQHVADEWGVKLTRVEITEVEIDANTREAMQIQLNAERMRRGVVTEAEGTKQATQLQADARLYMAQKEAEAKIKYEIEKIMNLINQSNNQISNLNNFNKCF